MPKGVPKKSKNRQIAEQEYERIQSRLEELDSQGKFSVLQVPKMSTTRITQSYINKLKAITDDVIEYSTTEKAKHEYEVHLHRSESAKRAYWNKRLQSGDYIVDEETGELISTKDLASVDYADEGESLIEDDVIIDNLFEALDSPTFDSDLSNLIRNAINDTIANAGKNALAERISENPDILDSLTELDGYYEVGDYKEKLSTIDRVFQVVTGEDISVDYLHEAEEILYNQRINYYSTHSSSSKRSRR